MDARHVSASVFAGADGAINMYFIHSGTIARTLAGVAEGDELYSKYCTQFTPSGFNTKVTTMTQVAHDNLKTLYACLMSRP